jgi:hypothetical protein
VKRARAVAAVVAAFGVAGCGNDPVSPVDQVPGEYRAVEWKVVSSTMTFDLLGGGGHLDLDLHEDGTTSGEFFIPAGVSPEPQLQRVSMAGTWSFGAGVVRFDMPGDTYVRFVDWQVEGRELFTEFSNGGLVLTTRLRR